MERPVRLRQGHVGRTDRGAVWSIGRADRHVTGVAAGAAAEFEKILPLPTVRKVEREAGEVVNPLNLSLTWKVKAAETGFAFSVYEMTFSPGSAIPIHIHPFAELFYVLEGQVDAMGIDAEGKLIWTELSAGECANAPATAPHGMRNRSAQPAKFLSVSNFENEKSFNDYQGLLETDLGRAMSSEQKSEALMNFLPNKRLLSLMYQDDKHGCF